MPRIDPLPREALAELEPFFPIVKPAMGFVVKPAMGFAPASLFTMGRRPDLLHALAALTGTVRPSARPATQPSFPTTSPMPTSTRWDGGKHGG